MYTGCKTPSGTKLPWIYTIFTLRSDVSLTTNLFHCNHPVCDFFFTVRIDTVTVAFHVQKGFTSRLSNMKVLERNPPRSSWTGGNLHFLTYGKDQEAISVSAPRPERTCETCVKSQALPSAFTLDNLWQNRLRRWSFLRQISLFYKSSAFLTAHGPCFPESGRPWPHVHIYALLARLRGKLRKYLFSKEFIYVPVSNENRESAVFAI